MGDSMRIRQLTGVISWSNCIRLDPKNNRRSPGTSKNNPIDGRLLKIIHTI